MTDSHEWRRFLEGWNEELLDRFHHEGRTAFVDDLVTDDVVARGWLGSAPASPREIEGLEARIGRAIPPSYRGFLETSNGFLLPGNIVPRLLSADEVGLYREIDGDGFAAWTGPAAAGGSGGAGFEADLASAIQVSARERVGSAVYLLNPGIVDSAGEWGALYLAHWLPGVNRYNSFSELMETERQNFASLADPLPPPPGLLTTLRTIVRSLFRSAPSAPGR